MRLADTYLAARDASYSVRRDIPLQSRVRLTQPVRVYEHGRQLDFPAGTIGVVCDYANAGFRGIEAAVATVHPRRNGLAVLTVSAGILEPQP
jgi:hypothetical protein